MKKLKLVAILLVGILGSLASAADVEPLYFNYISQADSQQAEWEYLLNYKIFGATGIRFKGWNIKIPDTSGWFGTARGDFIMGNDEDLPSGYIWVSGPILIGGDMSLDSGPDSLYSGPVRVTGDVLVPVDGFDTMPNSVVGLQCVQGTVDSKYERLVYSADRYFGANYGNCPTTVPEIRPNLSIPALRGTHTYQNAISVNNSVAYIDVPEGEGAYDLYISGISVQNQGTIYIRMPNGGRLTRIFLRDGLDLANGRLQIFIQYNDGNGNYQTIYNKDYSGNLLFYTDEDINFASFMSTDTILGTFITTGSITLSHQLTLAGQLLANYILVETDFDGRAFRYVPFDPPVLRIEPQVMTALEFSENDMLVKVPIALDMPASVNVYFDYCFDLDNSTATIDDVTLVEGYSFPRCSQGQTAMVVIPEGETAPADNPSNSVWIKVKNDNVVEGTETLRLKILNLTGAQLPGNKLDGYFDLVLNDGNIEPISADFEVTATEDQIFTFGSSMFAYQSVFDKEEQGVVITSLPGKGFLLSGDDTLKAANVLVPLDAATNIDLKFIGAKDSFGTPYTTFTFRVVDEDGIHSSEDYTVTVNVTPVNDAPTVSPATIVIGEVDNEVKSGTILASDIENDVLTYKFDDAFGGIFTEANYNKVTSLYEIDPATGAISVKSSAVLNYESADSVLTIKVKVIDNAATTSGVDKDSAFAAITLKIEDQNEAPVITDKGPFNVDENSVVSTFVGEVVATDPDIRNLNFGTLSYSIDENLNGSTADDVPFTIQQDGSIYVAAGANLDFETRSVWTFHVTVTDGDLSDNAEVVINVRDVNEEPVIVNLQEQYNEFEHVENGHVFATVKVVDQDVSDGVSTISAQIIDNNAGSPGVVTADQLFDVAIVEGAGDTLLLKFFVKDSALLDYEVLLANGADTVSYDICLILTDHDGGTGSFADTVLTTIYVKDVNEKPTANNAEFTVAENSAVGTFVGLVEASDPDIAHAAFGTLYYSLLDTTVGAASMFNIDAGGMITVAGNANLNYETDSVFYMNVRVSDGTFSDTVLVTISLNDVDDAPVIGGNLIYTIMENSAEGTAVGKVDAFDEDFWSVLTYRLVDVDPADETASLFNIDNNGNIFIAEGYTFDHETRNQYKVWVIVTDNGASRGFDDLSDSALITINVSDVNETPEFIDDGKPGYTVAENTAANAEIARYEIKDVDAPDADFAATLMVSLKDTNDQHVILADNLFGFAVETTSAGTFAVIRVENSPDFETVKEQNQDTIFTVILTLKDLAGDSAVLVKNIYVSDVNEKPTVEDVEFAVDENSKKDDSVGQVEASDPDVLNQAFSTLTYEIVGSVDVPFLLDSNVIKVKNASRLNYEADSLFTFHVRVSDGAFSDTALVIVRLNDVNENPKIVIDDDDDGEDDSEIFCIAHCDTTNRGSGPDSILTVGVDENSPTGTVVLSYVVADEDANDVTMLVARLDDNNNSGVDSLFSADLVFAGGKTKLVVSVKDGYKLDFEKIKEMHEVTLIVTDPQGCADTLVRVIKARDVNEAPTVEYAIFALEENSKKDDSVGVVMASDPDVLNPAFSTLTYEIVGSADVPFLLDSNVIKVKNARKLNYEVDSLFMFYVRVSDGAFSDTALVAVRLHDVNENPKIIIDDDVDGDDDSEIFCIAHCDTTNRGSGPDDIFTVGVYENALTGTIVLSYVVADEDVDDVTKLVARLDDNNNSGADSLFTVALDTTGSKPKIVVSVKDGDKLDFEKIKDTHEVSIIVTDYMGLADTLVRVIKVRDVNELPNVENAEFALDENSMKGDSVGVVMASDPDVLSPVFGTLTYQIIESGIPFTLDSNIIRVKDASKLNYEVNSLFTFHVRVSDGAFSDTALVTINLKDVNEPPVIQDVVFVVDENSAVGTIVGEVAASDPDIYRPAYGILTYSFVNESNQFYINPETGVITVASGAVLDYEKNSVYTLRVQVSDGSFLDTAVVTIKLADVNELPEENPDKTQQQEKIDCVNYEGDPDTRCVYTRLDAGSKGLRLFVVADGKKVTSANALANTDFFVYAPKATSDSVSVSDFIDGTKISHMTKVTSDETGFVHVAVDASYPISNVEIGTVRSVDAKVTISRIYNFYVPGIQYCLDENCNVPITNAASLQPVMGKDLNIYIRAYIPIGPSKGATDTTLDKSFYIKSLAAGNNLHYYNQNGLELPSQSLGSRVDLVKGRAVFAVRATGPVTSGSAFSINSYVESASDTSFLVTEVFPGNIRVADAKEPSGDSISISDTSEVAADTTGRGDSEVESGDNPGGGFDEPDIPGDIKFAMPSFRVVMTGKFRFTIVMDDSIAVLPRNYAVMDLQGRVLRQGVIASNETTVPLPGKGSFIVKVGLGYRRVNIR